MIGLFEVSVPTGRCEDDLQLLQYAFSHELKASLRPVLGFGYYLDHGEVSSDRTGEFQSKMIQAGTVLDCQLDALSEYVRLCLHPARSESLDLSTILRAVVEQQLSRFRLERECVELAESIPPVVADRGILKLVLSELISNALFFTGPQRVPQVKISCRLQGDHVETLIRDCGLGLAAESLPLLGKPFQRFHQESSGVGLGLTRVLRGLAVLRGGMRCSSQVGQGSLFLISLRAA